MFKYILYLTIVIGLFLGLSAVIAFLYEFLIIPITNFLFLILAFTLGSFIFLGILKVLISGIIGFIDELNTKGKKGIKAAQTTVGSLGILFFVLIMVSYNFEPKNSTFYFFGFFITYGGFVAMYFDVINIRAEMKAHGWE